jgi:hypothetical protein
VRIGASTGQAKPCFFSQGRHRRARMEQQGRAVSAGCAERRNARGHPPQLPIRAPLYVGNSGFSSALDVPEDR